MSPSTSRAIGRAAARLAGVLGALGAALGLAACDTAESAGFLSQAVPSSADFPPVSEVIQARCGSLDCHGREGSNLRIYGTNGLRLSDPDITGFGATTPEEVQADYESVIALEPDTLSLVFSEHKDPERLTMVRKARGTEDHKGNTAFAKDSDADRCLIAWLIGEPVDPAVCSLGAFIESPIPPP